MQDQIFASCNFVCVNRWMLTDIWNQLPLTVCQCTSVNQFKVALKIYLFLLLLN